MHLADHIRPLLRDHDCVIIPDFGGLVAEPVPARLSAARLQLGAPAKQVAFNQSLTRNDGLLVDALSQYLRIPAIQAREVLRHAVEDMHQDLRHSQRTELPGIGVFRQAPGRGLTFDYTGTENLLPAAFGLPMLSVRPVLATDARVAREKRPALLQTPPRLRPAATQRRWSRLLKGIGASVAASLLVLTGIRVYQGLDADMLPALGRSKAATTISSPGADAVNAPVAVVPEYTPAPEPQQAALAHNGWSSSSGAELAEQDQAREALPAGVVAADQAEVTNGKQPVASSPTASNLDSWAAETVTALADGSNTTDAWEEKAAVSANKPMAAAPKAAAGKAALKAKTAVAVNKAVAAKKIVAVPTGTKATTINQPLGRSYVVAGAFNTLAGAEASRQNLVRAGFTNAKVLVPNRTTRRYRASAVDYPDKASARLAAARLEAKARAKAGAKVKSKAPIYDVYSY